MTVVVIVKSLRERNEMLSNHPTCALMRTCEASVCFKRCHEAGLELYSFLQPDNTNKQTNRQTPSVFVVSVWFNFVVIIVVIVSCV